MNNMFDGLFTSQNLQTFNQSLEHWDVSNVTTMVNMFLNADAFNQPLDMWDVSNVTIMRQMFAATENFDQSLTTNCRKRGVKDRAATSAIASDVDQSNGIIHFITYSRLSSSQKMRTTRTTRAGQCKLPQ